MPDRKTSWGLSVWSSTRSCSGNTRYMDLALGQLRAEGKVLRDEDIELLFLLVHEHINLRGNITSA